eukprot:Pompholyxophrys_punicea_v1_NODE_618_length_1587_cov_7.462794.p3 type:complete len:123 gc:universal NODE_618_length_1587_cov_7.462794:1483-1115(-)
MNFVPIQAQHSHTTLIDDITSNMRKHQPTAATFIDLTKAYYTISHGKLIHKLEHHYNFSPNTLSIFKSYLTDRLQVTAIQQQACPSQLVTYGIPQGSTLSPTLFILYTNDIPNSTKHSEPYI